MPCFSYYFELLPEEQDVHIALLNELGVDSFIQHEMALEAFIDVPDETRLAAEIESYLLENKLKFEKRKHDLKDWNQEWESNFKAISIDDKLRIRAPFHKKDDRFETDVIISPKMAFGTGHHETTFMILEWMTSHDFKNLNILDFGCGTGILGIYAAKKGASRICFIDNDPLSIENTNENIRLNNLINTNCILGAKESIPDDNYNVIFANITRNVLLESFEILTSRLSMNGILILSGFLVTDSDAMLSNIKSQNLILTGQKQRADWMCYIFNKI